MYNQRFHQLLEARVFTRIKRLEDTVHQIFFNSLLLGADVVVRGGGCHDFLLEKVALLVAEYCAKNCRILTIERCFKQSAEVFPGDWAGIVGGNFLQRDVHCLSNS